MRLWQAEGKPCAHGTITGRSALPGRAWRGGAPAVLVGSWQVRSLGQACSTIPPHLSTGAQSPNLPAHAIGQT